MPRLQHLMRINPENIWRDLHIVGELLYEYFMEESYPGDHALAALLQDASALRQKGLLQPGLTQLLAGCVTPYGDLAYAEADDLLEGLQHLERELVIPLRVDVGCVSTLGNYIFRKNNQDACGHVVLHDTVGSEKRTSGFFCVADGIGGIADGEKASGLAVRAALGAFSRAWTYYGADALVEKPNGFAHEIARAVAQRLILEGEFAAEENRGGTTFTGVLLADRRIGICHLGDSRAVLLRDQRLIPLTEDHTLASILTLLGELDENDAQAHELSQRTISRFLSTASEIETQRIDNFSKASASKLEIAFDELQTQGLVLKPGDVCILTSDGAHGVWDTAEWPKLAERFAGHPQSLAEAIAQHALDEVGRDNATVLVIAVS